jgi:hypothetical protein
MSAAHSTSQEGMQCPKCGARSGDDWRQCEGRCPLPMSPHYDPLLEDELQRGLHPAGEVT